MTARNGRGDIDLAAINKNMVNLNLLACFLFFFLVLLLLLGIVIAFWQE